MANYYRNEKTNYKPKRIKVIPMLIVIVIMVNIISMNLWLIKNTANNYMIKQKIREGHISAVKVFELFRVVAENDSGAIENIFDSASSFDDSLVGITIKKSGETIYTGGKYFSDASTMEYQEKAYSFTEYDNPVFFATAEGVNGIVRGMEENFGASYSFAPVRTQNVHTWDESIRVQNKVRDYQEIWYVDYLDDYEIYSGHKVPLTDNDFQLCALTAFGLHFTAVLVWIVMLILTIRIVRSQKKLVEAFYYDKETQGKNWYYFIDYVNKKLRKRKNGRHKDGNIAVIQVRMSKFENFCSCYGEAEGEKLIVELYDTIKNNIPKKSLISRYDRANFAIYLSFTNEEELLKSVKSLLALLKEVRPMTSLIYKAGIYVIQDDNDGNASDAYYMASIAAQNAEDSMNEDVIFFNYSMRYELQWERKMINDLDRGIANKEFEVYMQPKYSCESEMPVAAEALVRWNHPTEGFLPPYKFIDIFEKTGYISKLDDYMVSRVAEIQAAGIASGLEPIPISVNISRMHFAKTDIAENICRLVDEYNVPHEYIEIELTESAFFSDREVILNTAKKFREYGFDVSLDDFGSGYSSLNSLCNLPIDIVKLDRGFFIDEENKEKSEAIVSEIINLAKKINVKVVAEGIENREQVDFLKEAGCDLIQGFYFAKPMPVKNFIKLMNPNYED